MDYLVFAIDEARFALPISAVEGVLHAVDIVEVPEEQIPHSVGVVDVHGTVLPVVAARSLFHKDQKPLQASDHFIIVKDNEQNFLLWVDSVQHVLKNPQIVEQQNGGLSHTDAGALLEEAEHSPLRLKGYSNTDGGITIMTDLWKKDS